MLCAWPWPGAFVPRVTLSVNVVPCLTYTGEREAELCNSQVPGSGLTAGSAWAGLCLLPLCGQCTRTFHLKARIRSTLPEGVVVWHDDLSLPEKVRELHWREQRPGAAGALCLAGAWGPVLHLLVRVTQ